MKKEDNWAVDYISLYLITTVSDNATFVYLSHSCIKPFNLWPQIALLLLIQTGSKGPGGGGEVTALEVQEGCDMTSPC